MDGSALSFLDLIEGLKKNNINFYVVYPARSKNANLLLEKFKELEINSYSATVAMSVYPRIMNLKDFLLFPVRILKLIIKKFVSYVQIKSIAIKLSPDIIHTNTGVIHEGEKVARKLKIPHCWHIREYQDKDFNMKIFPFKQKFISALKRTNVISITKNLAEHFDLQTSKNVHNINDGVLFEKEKNYIHNKEKYFLCASRISPEKGIYETIQCFAEFCKINNEYKLLIAGYYSDKKYMNELNSLVTELELTEKVKFLGFKNKDEISQLMSKATALIVSSKCEGFGRMTAEVLFYGCLVIGRNSGGTKEVLENTNGGWLYNNQNELTQFMHEVIKISNTEQYKDKILTAQKIAVANYSIEQNGNKIYNLYKELITK